MLQEKLVRGLNACALHEMEFSLNLQTQIFSNPLGVNSVEDEQEIGGDRSSLSAS